MWGMRTRAQHTCACTDNTKTHFIQRASLAQSAFSPVSKSGKSIPFSCRAIRRFASQIPANFVGPQPVKPSGTPLFVLAIRAADGLSELLSLTTSVGSVALSNRLLRVLILASVS